MIETLLLLIAGGVIAIGVIQHRHRTWVRTEFRRNALSHTRIVERLPLAPAAAPFNLVPADRKVTRAWPYALPAAPEEDWNDDYPRTSLFGVVD